MAENSFSSLNAEGAPFEKDKAPVKRSQADLESVTAETVQLNQSMARSVQAENVTLDNSAAQHIQAQTIEATNSGIAVVQAASLNVSNAGVLIASAEQAKIQGNVGLMIGQSVQFKDHRTGVVITREAHGDHIQSVIFLAGQSHGPVETIADQRSVALFGLSFGVAIGLVMSLFRLFKNR